MPSVTRRALLIGGIYFQARSLVAQSASKPLPRRGEFAQIIDPLTESVVTRLTSPTSAAFLPAPQNRFISAKGRFLILSSDRGGSLAPYHVDLQNGTVRQLTEAAKLDPKSLTLDASERNLLFLDGGALRAYSFANKRVRTVTEGVKAFSAASEFRVESRNPSGLVVLRPDRVENLGGPIIASGGFSNCFLSPDASITLLIQGSGLEKSLLVLPLTGAPATAASKPVVRGPLSYPFWTPDSQTVVYLRDLELRQLAVREGKDDLLTKTSMFAAFSPNRDQSVFVGASRSKAQPAIVLMVRSGRSEMILCQHRATQASAVSPVFSPDSRRIYFQSDYGGNSAVYSVNTESLVEPTEQETHKS